MRNKRALKMCMGILLVLTLAGPLVSFAGDSQAAEKQKQPEAKAVPAATVTDIRLSFKRDPRAVDPFRGIGPWVTGSNYGGATAQDTVEARVEGVDAARKSVKISPQWISSDPEMVTVSPSQGDDVQITVRRAGESKLKITYQGISKELVLRAKYQGKFMLFEIEEAMAAKPNVPTATEAPPARKNKNDVSYAAGMNLAKALEEQSEEVDVDSLMQGVKDELSGGKTRMTEEQALAALEGLQIDQRIVEEGLNRKAVGEKNQREGEAFLAENKKKEGVVTLPSGLQYKIIKAGEGKKPTANDVVNVQYRGTFIDGKEFDSSFERHAPANIPVKAVIKGWTEALQLMPVGSRWQLFVPSDLAYGERGAGGGSGKRAGGPRPQTVGPNATLIFEVELLSVQEPGAKPPASNSRAQENELTPEMVEQLKKVTQSEPKSEKNQ
jgi:FKBP-type peptidyl-prolyl cis-trans isomerase FklB